MNKSELIQHVAESTDMKLAEASRVVETVFDTITDSLKKREQVAVAGFGTFVAKSRAAREGRNPHGIGDLLLELSSPPAGREEFPTNRDKFNQEDTKPEVRNGLSQHGNRLATKVNGCIPVYRGKYA